MAIINWDVKVLREPRPPDPILDPLDPNNLIINMADAQVPVPI